MVGLVIVSHSHKIAEGLLELAREMAGPEVRIAATGGLDLPDRPLGTDALSIVEAIRQVDTEDGVVVLADLGSAVLNAEMALDMLARDVRARVRLSAAPLVEGAIAAAAQARLGASIDRVIAEADRSLGPKEAQLGESASSVPSSGGLVTDAGARLLRLVVPNRLGWHARPGARLLALAGQFAATISVRNLTTGAGPVKAASMNDLLLIGARQGHEVEFRANGDQAQAALDAIGNLARQNFGDDDAAEAAVSAVLPAQPEAAPVTEGAWRGVPASPGLAVGTAAILRGTAELTDQPMAGPPGAEWSRLERAISETMDELLAKRDETLTRAGASVAAIFDAERALLSDPALVEATRQAMATRGLGPAAAMRAAAEEIAGRLEATTDDYLRASAADVRHVARQVIERLRAGPPNQSIVNEHGAGVILVSDEFSPTDVVGVKEGVAGLCAARGAATGHAAVLARALGIPAVFGLGDRLLQVGAGARMAIDADRGLVWLEPSADVLVAIETRMARDRELERSARATSARPAITRDGRRVEVAVNVGNAAEAAAGLRVGAEAVGLFRTELLFVDRRAAPDEEEQYADYLDVAKAMQGRPVIIRTLDIGGDKPLPYLRHVREDNPFLGQRGLRFSLTHLDLFVAQLRAIARVAADHPISVMFPMVSTLGEWRRARALWHEHAAGLARRDVSLGVMIEVPAAALSVRQLAAEVDFVSIGTNDLTQYLFAAERGNADVAALNDAWHPAVLRLIHQVCEAAHAAGRWVGVCGELAADAAATPLLVGLGVDELSMSAPAIPKVKQAVRGADTSRARAMAERVLASVDADEARSRAREAAS